MAACARPRCGFKKARVAVARKLAVILHAMWKTNAGFPLERKRSMSNMFS